VHREVKMTRRFPLLVTAYCALALSAVGADWPQWRGPDRTDISRETGLLTSWSAGGPPLLWTYDAAGIGYSGPAIVGDRLFTMGSRDEVEYLYALNTQTGKEVWATEIGPMLRNGYGSGPRGTPTVEGDLVFAIGGQGELVCVEARTGKKRWHVSLTDDLGGQEPHWGFTEAPLVDGAKLVCSPGGSQGSLAALDKQTGKVLWRSRGLTDPAAYSSIIVAEIGGGRQYIQMTARHVVGVAAEDGRLLWQSGERSNPTAVIPTPIYHDGYVYITSGYADRGGGCALLKLTPDGSEFKVDVVYSDKSMTNHHGGVILVGDYLYGYSDSQGGRWVCQEFKTGKIVWEAKKLDKGSLTYADGHFYCYGERDGTAVLIKATTEGWEESGHFKIPHQTQQPRGAGHIWTHPVVANGRLYLRDQDLIFCFNIKKGG
jgi:outer membrane protein assembly factor BamB